MRKVLTDRQLAELKLLLQERQEQLRSELLADRKDEASEPSHEVRHGGEEYFETLLKDVGSNIADRRIREARAVKDALDRIESGHYGICEDCGDSIQFERLLAFPVAKRCIDCKQAYEQETGA